MVEPAAASAPAPVGDRLRAEIERFGYYPELVVDALMTVVVDERIENFFVHHETMFDHDEVRRHLTVLVRTPTRLVLTHADDFPHSMSNHVAPESTLASVTTDAVRLRDITSFGLSRMVENPHAPIAEQQLRELILNVQWGFIHRIDIGPATCADPNCEIDHGLSGTTTGDDLAIRVSAAAEGPVAVQRLTTFAQELSLAIAHA